MNTGEWLVIIILAIPVAALSIVRFVGEARGWPTWVGAATLLLVPAALAFAWATLHYGGEPWVRVVPGFAVGLLVLVSASTQWTRPVLRWTGAVLVLGLAVALFYVGRDLQGEPYADQVQAARAQLVRLEAIAANEGAPAPAAGSVTSDAVEEAISQACLAVAQAYPTFAEDLACQADTGGSQSRSADDAIADSQSLDNVPVAVAVMELQLARYRQVVAGGDAATAAVEAAQANLEEAAKEDPRPVYIVPETITAGAQGVLGGLPGNEDQPLALDLTLWLLFLLAALGGWRWLERRVGRQMPGPVTVQFGSTDGKDTTATAEQQAAFRAALFKNVSEPGSAPGGSATAPITDLAEITTAASPGKWFDSLVKAVQGALSVRTGYGVIVDAVPPEKADAKLDPENAGGTSRTSAGQPGSQANAKSNSQHRLLIRLVELPSWTQVAVHEVARENAVDAFRAAGYWAAATVLQRSTRIPKWATWTGDTSEALARYDSVDQPTLEALEQAAAAAPNSGLLLHNLADRYDLEGRAVDAMYLHARTVIQFPDYLPARYRLAVGLTTVWKDFDKRWKPLAFSQRLFVANSLRGASESIGVDAPDPRLLADLQGGGAKTEFEELAKNMYSKLIDDSKMYRLALRTLRRSERALWLPELSKAITPNGPIHRWFWQVYAASLIVHQPTDIRVRRAEQRAKKRGVWWQISYNLACYHNRQKNHEEALDWLQRARDQHGSHNMTRDWVRTDPDLSTLDGEPRLMLLLDSLKHEENSDA